MSGVRRDSPSRMVALDLMLRTFMNSTEFNDIQSKNWDAIAKLIPGTTPRECEQRFEELQIAAGDLAAVGDLSTIAAQRIHPLPRSHLTHLSLTKYVKGLIKDDRTLLNRSASNTEYGAIVKEPTTTNNQMEKTCKVQAVKVETHSEPVDQGPNMVIHVCDEAKNLKQDFVCPRDLLVQEMQYFSEYLSVDAQRWEEVDISVHCDVQIFDWLMRFVKRRDPTSTQTVPHLEPSNVVSILISSDFLKMKNLVEECVKYCHDNLSAIVATPCNMNCINDDLITRISALFTDTEIDDVKDRKDKFKSKLFCKKIVDLFKSGQKAASLYRCQFCKRIITHSLQSKVKCLTKRVTIDHHGNIAFNHVRDPAWDVNDYLMCLRNQAKNWQEVYWQIWGTVNFLCCSRCNQVFPCSELGHCRFHPDTAQYISGEGLKQTPIGNYGCCNLDVLRFDPLEENNGCRVRDHVVQLQGEDGSDSKILDILLQRRDIICTSPPSLENERGHDINVFCDEEAVLGLSNEGGLTKGQLQHVFPDDNAMFARPESGVSRYETSVDDDDDDSDDEIGDEEVHKAKASKQLKSRRRISNRLFSAKQLSSTSVEHNVSCIPYVRHKWDSQRSLRFNQDAQRQDDQKRMNELINYLVKQRVSSTDKIRHREYAGGIFSRLESQFRNTYQTSKTSTLQPIQKSKTRLNPRP
ncbi:SANT and BTB domain regulator of class switch recombination-like isoform X2 [Antedon mediterranea]|uniref:SANT and BTB domain regulator of class switch recombination-like isoform X2 n=1 Tax=Antedon mediterranea TaxID=105859 RepID=UPI003AF6EB8B